MGLRAIPDASAGSARALEEPLRPRRARRIPLGANDVSPILGWASNQFRGWPWKQQAQGR